jgi:hypothetical protein
MTLFLPQVRTGPIFWSDVQAPMSDVLAAQAEEAWVRSPTPSIGRAIELRNAAQGVPLGVGADTGEIQLAEPSPMVSAQDARARIKEEGLQLTVPDTGIRQDQLDILIERKSNERRRKDIMARGPSGIGPAMANIGTALAVSAMDPLNVATAFVPVIGPSRYATALAQAGGAVGRGLVRARVGAVEGAVGAAIVEPIVYGVAQQEQADYHLADSLLAIGLGTALGGGLHVGIGAAGDAIARGLPWQTTKPVDAPIPRILEQVPAEAREAALRVGISQALTGRAIDVEPALRSSETPIRGGEFEQPTAAVRQAGAAIAGEPAPPARSEVPLATETVPPQTPDTVRFYHGGVDPTSGGPRWLTPDPAYARDFRTGGGKPNEVHYVDVPNGHPVEVAARLWDEIDEAGQTNMVGRYGNIEASEDIAKQLKPFAPMNVSKLAVRQAVTSSSPFRPEDVAAAGAKNFTPEEGRLVDMQAVRAGDETVKAAPANDDAAVIQESLADIMQDTQNLARALGDEELVARELKPFDELTETADAYGRAVQAAANCGLRRGGG